MKRRMQKTTTKTVGCPQEERTESENNEGVQIFMWISENSLVTVQPTLGNLLEWMMSPENLTKAIKQVRKNKGAGGVDGMDVEALLPYLQNHQDELIESIMEGTYRPNPVRRVEIPKDNGKKRQLGIPTVVDRVIQQAISQVLTTIYDPKFSESSYGFRQHRSAHDAVRKVKELVTRGHKYSVDLDLEKFFDTVNHSKLLEVMSRTIKDGRVVSLISRYLNAGVMKGRKYEESTKGVPQGGPLSPILSNIMLNELDEELERRGHEFVRYADDRMILCGSKRGAERICESITKYIECKLYLKVNREKTQTGKINKGIKYLGYQFHVKDGICRLGVHAKTQKKLKSKIKELTMRSNGVSFSKRKRSIKAYMRGWMEYYKETELISFMVRIDSWYRRRLRMCIWKSWKKPITRFRNLIKCGIKKSIARSCANARQGFWRMAGGMVLHKAMSNENLRKAGYPCLMDYYSLLHVE